jgi:hypothetical protein
MKRIGLCATAALLLFFIQGCKEDKDRTQVLEYLNDGILRIYELEQSALKHYAGVTGENYSSDEALYEALKESVIPTYSRFVMLLEEIQPPNDELVALHSIYIKSAHSFQTGFAILLAAIGKKDPAMVEQANTYITEARQKGEAWREEFFALCEKKGIKLVFEEKQDPASRECDESGSH